MTLQDPPSFLEALAAAGKAQQTLGGGRQTRNTTRAATVASRTKRHVRFSDQVTTGTARDGDNNLTAKDEATAGLKCKTTAKEKQPPQVKQRKVR